MATMNMQPADVCVSIKECAHIAVHNNTQSAPVGTAQGEISVIDAQTVRLQMLLICQRNGLFIFFLPSKEILLVTVKWKKIQIVSTCNIFYIEEFSLNYNITD